MIARVILVFLVSFAVVQYVVIQTSTSQSKPFQTDKHYTHEESNTHEPQLFLKEDPKIDNYTKWCLDTSHNNIYNLGSKLNCKDNSEAFSMSFLVAIMVTIFIEYVTHKLEEVHYHKR
jgi:hypothetical protein